MIPVNPSGKNPVTDGFLHRLRPEFSTIEKKSTWALNRIIRRLCNLQRGHGDKTYGLISVVIFNIKREIRRRDPGACSHNHRTHMLSDHAFVRIVEKIHGLDIDDLKNKAINDLKNSKYYEPIHVEGQIVTIAERGSQ